MPSSPSLLRDLQAQVTNLEEALRQRCEAEPAVDAPLRIEYDAAKARNRTAQTYAVWRGEELTQAAVAWVLATVFIRFLEDNELLETPVLSGPGPRLQRARDEQELYFRDHPSHTEREYLLHVFTTAGTLPTLSGFFDRRHNPLWRAAPAGDDARDLLLFWQKTDPTTGLPLHDFTDPAWDTRFLGDLYQDLSAAARKKYALLQTPDFIEAFILDRTLTPAIETFGYQTVRLIDPTCGSGHFVLGGFHRLFRLWQDDHPSDNPRVLAQKALDGVYGVDLNPFAVAIARFRLLLAALKVCHIRRLKDAPDFQLHLATGDSLLHGRRFNNESLVGTQQTFGGDEDLFRDELKHHYEVEDTEALHRILGKQYHAVVGNPPYITVKDRAVSELYRARYPSCHRKYSLSVPFMERFFDLAVKGDGTPQRSAGFVGQITANSFMKREFGKKLIEEYLPLWDLTHIVDTSGAYIPGHTTPTAILFGKNQLPVNGTIRTVLGIRGEPEEPYEPSLGLVWQAICKQIDEPGSKSQWVSVGNSERATFHQHPWSIGGGGAAELKEVIDEAGVKTFTGMTDAMGFFGIVAADEVMVARGADFQRKQVAEDYFRPLVVGDLVRDWLIDETEHVLFPYSLGGLRALSEMPFLHRWLWPARTTLGNRATFNKRTYFAEGRPWWAWHQIALDRLRPPLTITFSFVATHNHFSLDIGGKVFKQTAPIVKLKPDVPVKDYLELLGLLNSSAACFWLKQVVTSKGLGGQGGGIKPEHWHRAYEFDSTKLGSFPIPTRQPSQLPKAIANASSALQAQTPAATLASWSGPESGELRTRLATARAQATHLRRQLIAWQEELDWQIYEAFGLVESAAASGPAAVSLTEDEAMDSVAECGLELGERAFEIVLARKIAAGEVQTTWFELHGSTALTELPRQWSPAYRELVERRLRRIADDPAIRLIEQPEYKRRWNTEPWEDQLQRAARNWLLTRLETYFFGGERMIFSTSSSSSSSSSNSKLPSPFPNSSPSSFRASREPALVSVNQLADAAQHDPAFLEVAAVLEGGEGFSVAKVVRELVEGASVPNLPVDRYKPSGLSHRRDWERTWELQRQEDAIDADVGIDAPGLKEFEKAARVERAKQLKKERIGDIPVPPKYKSADFKQSTYWSLRGKLDVPKERWVLYQGAERDGDTSPVIAWAGWDHLQQATALAAYYLDAKQNQTWPAPRLHRLLAGLLDLLPWLRQWHNAPDPSLGMGMGEYFAGFLEVECQALGVTQLEIEALRWS